MASGAEVLRLPLTRPPPHLEGNLIFHRPTKFGRPKRAFFVLLEAVIHQYESKDTYHKGQRSREALKIHLEEVCGITEILMSNKHYKNCSFSLTLNDKEATEYKFSAESRQTMEKWVDGLREAKEFWMQHHIRKEFKQKISTEPDHLNETTLSVHNEADNLDDSISSSSSENCEPVQVSVTTWDRVTHKILLPCVFDMEELLSALTGKLQSTTCAACPICKLQQSTMELWAVTANGIGQKLESECGALDVSKHGKHFYLLVHNYKLLIIHFEDGTFQVLPCLVSITAKEVPYLPMLADKLSSLGYNNFGLFLVNDTGTSFLFTPEEEPLKHSFQGRLILKNRALTASAPVTSRSLEIQKQKLRKNQQNRKYREALKIVEKEKCKQPSNFHVSNTSNREFSPPDGLVFCYEHYSLSNDSNQAPVSADYVEHTNIALASTDGENNCTEPRQSVESSSVSQPGDNSVDEQLVTNKVTDSGLQEKDEAEFTEGQGSVKIATRFSQERECYTPDIEEKCEVNSQLNTNSSVASQHLSNDQTKGESLELPKCSAENGPCPGQMEDRIKFGSIDFHRDESLCNGSDTCETRSRGDPASTDDVNSIAAAASTSGNKDVKVEPNLTPGNEFMNHNNKTSTFDAGANEEIPAQNEGDETSLPSTAFSDIRPSLAPDGTPPDKARCTAEPVTDPVGTTEPIHTNFPGYSTVANKRTVGRCASCVFDKRPPVEIHQCDYTIVGSPRVLELALKVCSSHKVNEEEVGEANKFLRICLSGWHLQCENGLWIVVDQRVSPRHSDNLSNAVKIQISERLEALFDKEEKLWTVVENVHVANKVYRNQIQNEDLNVTFTVTKDSSDDPNSAVSVTEDSSNYQDVTPKDRFVRPDFSRSNAQQDRNVTSSGNKAESSNNKAQSVEIENPGSLETHKPAGVYTAVADSSPQGALHEAIQRILQNMFEFSESPEDSKHEGIVDSVCRPLCSPLWNILSVGIRKRFIGKYTVWNVVEEFKDVSSHVRQTVDWVNNRYASLSEIQKFQAFVCECLNIGHGTLHQWLESVLRQNKKRLGKYYNQDGIVFQLPREKMEELVLDLSRISVLSFELNFESWIKMQGFDVNEAAFTFE